MIKLKKNCWKSSRTAKNSIEMVGNLKYEKKIVTNHWKLVKNLTKVGDKCKKFIKKHENDVEK